MKFQRICQWYLLSTIHRWRDVFQSVNEITDFVSILSSRIFQEAFSLPFCLFTSSGIFFNTSFLFTHFLLRFYSQIFSFFNHFFLSIRICSLFLNLVFLYLLAIKPDERNQIHSFQIISVTNFFLFFFFLWNENQITFI